MKKAIIPTVILVLFAGLGCDLFSIPKEPEDPVPEWQLPLTPRAVIEDIEWCYNNADGPSYTTLLDEDNFVFYFDPGDVGGDLDIPVSWTYDLEVDATQNLFYAVGAPNITLELTIDEDDEPGPYDIMFRLDDVAYELHVYVPEDDMNYIANAHANFELSKFEDDDGLMRWWLTKWWDKVTI